VERKGRKKEAARPLGGFVGRQFWAPKSRIDGAVIIDE